MSVCPVIQGGLGNQMFQVASVWSLSKKTRRPFKINKKYIIPNKHSQIDYFSEPKSLLSYWNPYFTQKETTKVLQEDSHFAPKDWEKILTQTKKDDIVLQGYFQSHTFIEPFDKEFISHLSWNTQVVQKYDELPNSIFIHVRRGDYLQAGIKDVHYIDMTQYYKTALQKIKDSVKHAYIFSNDIAYCESVQMFDDIRTTVVKETNEVDNLYLMSQCGQGGIGVNSSFSWWGLYLNRDRPHLYLPNKWFNDSRFNISGFYFPQCTVLSI
jgi:hypothetical protein